jgi:tetratricopeptide (TPR) repeat protein
MMSRDGALARNSLGESTILSTIITDKPHFSTANLADLTPITFARMLVPMVHRGHYILCRTATPAYVSLAVNVILEDTEGGICFTGLYNCAPMADIEPDEWLPLATVVVVKEPYLKFLWSGRVMMRVDSPTDLVLLHRSSTFLRNTPWYAPLPIDFDECKKIANQHFGQGHMLQALEFYDFALEHRPDDPLINLNKSAAFLRLGRFFEARQAVERAMADQSSLVNTDPRLKHKALFRLGQAAYGLRDWEKAIQINSQLTDDASRHSLEQSRLRLSEARTGSYDMEALGKSMGLIVYHDVADFVGDVVIAQIPGKGRGLRTTRGVPAGTLLLASKAFATGNPRKWAEKNITLLTFNVSRNETTKAADAHLYVNMIYALRNNPHRTSELYQLYADGFPQVELPDGMIDPGRIKAIIDSNSFAIENEFDRQAQEATMDTSGVWILPSFINHSCVDNARRCFYGDLLMVRAIKDLRAGEEVLISYCPGTAEVRQNRMRWWQINCDCPWCNERVNTPRQAVERREYLLKTGPWSRDGHRRLSSIIKWIQSLDATYRPGDQFKNEMAPPLLTLMAAYMHEANADQAIATGRRILGLQPAIQAGTRVMVHMMIADLYLQTGRSDSAKEELRTMCGFCWKRARVTLRQLRTVAAQAMSNGDPSVVLAESLRELEEEQLAHSVERGPSGLTEI